MIQLEALIRESNDLEALPASASRLAGIFADEDWEMDQVIDAVSLDPAITSRVLRIANSALFAGVEEITSVERAAQRVGAGTMLALSVGMGARSTLTCSMPEYGVAEGVLWRHSVASALAADLVQLVCKVKVPAEAVAAALLHDVGRLVLSRHMKPEVLELLAQDQAVDGVDGLGAEMEILEVHHGEVGGLIAQNWKLPAIIVTGITYHHNPGDVEDPHEQLVCDVVCVANAVATVRGFGLGHGETSTDEARESCERLGMTDAGFQELCDLLSERVEQVLAWYK